MSLFERFFGKRGPDDQPTDLVAGSKKKDGPTLQVLLTGTSKLDPRTVTAALRAYHPSLAQARCEVAEDLQQEGKTFGLAGWGEHVLQLVGFDVPMPREPVEQCVAPSHYGQNLKEQARAHKAHLLLWYVGRATDVLEQFVALAAFAGALADLGAIVVLNETAHTSFPAAALSGKNTKGDILELLRTLPLPVLYAGFVKYNVPDDTRVWMRTYGAHVLGLPDFAVCANGHHEGQRYFDMFDSMWRYMLNSGRRLAVGHTMQVGADDFLHCRAPKKKEPWLESHGEMLVVELIGRDQINQ
jgi:hypothetical protein